MITTRKKNIFEGLKGDTKVSTKWLHHQKDFGVIFEKKQQHNNVVIFFINTACIKEKPNNGKL